jgi:phospholipase C
MFNFNKQRTDRVLLDEQTGTVASITNTRPGNNDAGSRDGRSGTNAGQ